MSKISEFTTNEKKIKTISHMYFYAIKENVSFGLKEIDRYNPYDSFIDRVNKAFCSLNEVERHIINNEFFYDSYPSWWEEFYSRSTFYRYKKEAMRHFLEGYNHEDC